MECQHFKESDAAVAMRNLGHALMYLHNHRIVHRGVSPENLFVSFGCEHYSSGLHVRMNCQRITASGNTNVYSVYVRALLTIPQCISESTMFVNRNVGTH